MFSGLAVFLGALWWMNRQQGAGTGTESLPFFGGSEGTPALAGNGPVTFNIGDGPTAGPTSPGTGSSCCLACSGNNPSGMIAFGTQGDLLNFLAQAGTPSDTDISNWQ